MRIGFFHARKHYLRYITTTVEALVERGHEVVICASDRKPKVKLPYAIRGHPQVSAAVHSSRRDDGVEPALHVIRALRDALRYESPALRSALATRARAYEQLTMTLAHAGVSLIVEPPDHPADGSELGLDAVLAAAERLLPPSRPMVAFIEEHAFDVVMAVTRVNFRSNDLGVMRAAQAAGTPCGLVVWSWDNLSSKGLIHERPDRLFVWNDLQAREAVELHGLEPAAIEVTGAPRFDEFFALEPSGSRDDLLAGWGLDPTRRTILYLGSSEFIIRSEPEFVDEWLSALRNGPDDVLREANVIVRPHPGALDQPEWLAWKPTDPRVAAPAVEQRGRQLYDQISASDAVVALNTSAELEAAILDRPVLTITIGERAPGQHGTSHFSYLLAEHGGFVESSASLDEHLSQLSRALREDPRASERRRFVQSFLRPHGLDRPAGIELADAIERLAGGSG